MRPRIVYIVDNLRTGGAQTQLARLIQGLGDHDLDVRVLCLGEQNDSLMRQIGPQRVAVYPMPCIWKPRFWLSYNKVRQSVRAIKPDIVHTYLNTSNVFGAYAARRANVPHIITSRRDMGHFRSGRIAAMERWSNKFCQRVVCVSEAVRQQTLASEGLAPEKAVVLYGGVDTDLFAPQRTREDNSRPLHVGMVAAMDRPMKGHADFLESARLVLEKRQDILFTLVGDGQLRGELEAFVEKHGMSRSVQFAGQSNEVQEAVRGWDIFVMPSHSEGFSNAVLEAMAMGVPVLANGLEGNLEIIEDGISGILVEPRDVRQMADRILHFADHRDELRRMGTQARVKIEAHFTLKHMVERYKSFYNGLLNGQ